MESCIILWKNPNFRALSNRWYYFGFQVFIYVPFFFQTSFIEIKVNCFKNFSNASPHHKYCFFFSDQFALHLFFGIGSLVINEYFFDHQCYGSKTDFQCYKELLSNGYSSAIFWWQKFSIIFFKFDYVAVYNIGNRIFVVLGQPVFS